MTLTEIKDFFLIKESQKNYQELKKNFTDKQIEDNPKSFITAILKQTYGFPISFMDESAEELIHISEEKSQKVYENYADEILDGEYEDLYDFTQELSANLANFPED